MENKDSRGRYDLSLCMAEEAVSLVLSGHCSSCKADFDRAQERLSQAVKALL